MKKILIIILSICFLLTTVASVIGFIEHNSSNEKPTDKNPTNQDNNNGLITYEYYLENEPVDEMPANYVDGDIKYIFSKYQCTNNLSGTFDIYVWKFTPSEDKKSECKLYFVKSLYEVTVTATNGSVHGDNNGKFTVVRENEGQFNVVPNEGYKYKNVVCSNENEAIYDISTNTLTISSVMEDIACKVNFEIKKFKVKINVVNGTGSTTETQKYGSDVTVIVKAKDGYEKPTVKCTNGQNGSIKNNTLNVVRLTDNTTCTVTYKKIPIVTHTIKINLGSGLKIVAGSLSQQVKDGTDGKFSIKPDEGHSVNLSCNVKPSSSNTDPDGTVNYTFLNVTKDITCSASAS